jgi:hypothetical protein
MTIQLLGNRLWYRLISLTMMKPFSTWTAKSQFFAAAAMFGLVAFVPLFVAEGLRHMGFDTVGFGMAWGATGGVFCTLLVVVCLIVSVVLSALGK